MVRIRCVVERITYQNPDSGYTVLKARVKDFSELVPVIGNLLDVNIGSVLLVEGNWKVDKQYGRQFVAESWEETMPATIYGIEKYLGSGLIKGVGPKFAKRIVKLFGIDTISVIEDDIARLHDVPGIGEKRIQMIHDSWQRQKEVKNIMLFLQSNGVSTSFAAKIYKQYGNESIQKVKENPFRLADDIWGIGFKTADAIAQKIGIAKDFYVRIRSGIIYALSQLADEGHAFSQRELLVDNARALLEVDGVQVSYAIDQMVQDKDVFSEDDAIFLAPFYYAEVGVANKLKKILISPASDEDTNSLGLDMNVNIAELEKELGIKYDEFQAQAINMAIQSKIMVLTGGPGTGKTTTTQGIIEAFKAKGLEIVLAAPTGRAAKRISEATGMEAKTIHRLLEYKPPEGYQRNEDNPVLGDVLIVDECSMIDIILMNALLKAIPVTMRLILVGDIDQLPSVGAGNVLRDIIDSDVIPVIQLTKIFRQAQSSRIITNAHKINKGIFPDISNGRNTDFFFIERDDPESAATEIIELVASKLPNYYKVKPSEIQVLAPMQRGIIGAATLNMSLQEKLNPSGDAIRYRGYVFRLYDKVMQIKNNYDKEVFNGDIGRIIDVNSDDKTLLVRFDNRGVSYEMTDLDELVHAYATTIHKAQGSEYPIVVMPILMTNYIMLQRNLVYTGITRAKKILVIVGSKKALGVAVRNNSVVRRNTRLKERLRN